MKRYREWLLAIAFVLVGMVPAQGQSLVTGTAGETLAASKIVYLSDGSGGKTAGKWYLADKANTYSSSLASLVGWTPASITINTTGGIRLGGIATYSVTLTVKTLYYVGTSGALTSIKPTNARVVGSADSTRTLVLRSDGYFGGGTEDYIDLRKFGALCDGSTNSLTAWNTAITAGLLKLYLPPSCKVAYTTNGGFVLPTNLDVLGGDTLTSQLHAYCVAVATCDAAGTAGAGGFLYANSYVRLRNVNVKGNSCAPGEIYVVLGCPVQLYVNISEAIGGDPGQVVLQTYAGISIEAGATVLPGGQSGIVVLQSGPGGGIYTGYRGTSALGYGLEANISTSTDGGRALLISRATDNLGLDIVDTGATGATYGNPSMRIFSAQRTAGNYFNLWHSTTTWGGTGIDFDFGNSGTFSGKFINAKLAGASKFSVDASGNVVLTGTLTPTSGQVIFPATQNASAGANTLDDYEEGTWTPIDSSGAGLTLTSVSGSYIKVGKQVSFICQFTYPSTADGTPAKIGGLPFTSANSNAAVTIGYQSGGQAAQHAYQQASTTTIIFPVAVTGTNSTNAQMTVTTLVLSGTYFATN
jgi:hypothetical protein